MKPSPKVFFQVYILLFVLRNFYFTQDKVREDQAQTDFFQNGVNSIIFRKLSLEVARINKNIIRENMSTNDKLLRTDCIFHKSKECLPLISRFEKDFPFKLLASQDVHAVVSPDNFIFVETTVSNTLKKIKRGITKYNKFVNPMCNFAVE